MPKRMQFRLENTPKSVELAEKQRVVVLEVIESAEDWTYQEVADARHLGLRF